MKTFIIDIGDDDEICLILTVIVRGVINISRELEVQCLIPSSD